MRTDETRTTDRRKVLASMTFIGLIAIAISITVFAGSWGDGQRADPQPLFALPDNVELSDGTSAWTADKNAGGNSLTNLDTTITFEMDDGSVIFVDGTDIFYVSSDGATTNDLTGAAGGATAGAVFSRSVTINAPTNVIVFRPVFTNLPVVNITIEDVGQDHGVDIIDVFSNRVIFTVRNTNNIPLFSNMTAHIVAWEETSDFYQSLNALTFDGVDEYVAVPDDDVLDFGTATDFSITLWMKMGAEADFVSLINKQDANNFDNSGWSVLASGGGMRMLQFRIGSGGTNTQNDHLNGTVDLGDDNWHFCAITVKRGVVIATYVDGALDCPTTSLSGFGGTMNNAEELWFGRRKLTASDGFFTGTMDNVNIFNIALTSLQVQEMYNAGEPSDPDTISTEADRVGSWSLGDPPDLFNDLNDTINTNDGNGVNMAIGNIVTDTPTP